MRVPAFLLAGVIVSAAPGAPQVKIDELSLMTTPVLLFNGAQQVSMGTGFFFARTDASGNIQAPFLVTAEHVLTGNPAGQAGSAKGDRIRFYLHRDLEKPADVKVVEFPLYSKSGQPKWVVSSKDSQADAAILPIPVETFDGTRVVLFGEKDAVTADTRVPPTSAVTLVGYPHAFFDRTNYLPIWKTGFVASETAYDFEGRRVFLIDVPALGGLSGAPVLTVIDNARRLLGVFASAPLPDKRFIDDVPAGKAPAAAPAAITLAHVWKAAIVVDAVKGFDAAAYETRIR